MAIFTVMTPTDDEIAVYLREKYWPVIAGALLVCGLNPQSSSGPIDEARCREMSSGGMHQYAKPLRIIALWRSRIGTGDLVRPRNFLSWCKYFNIHEVDAFLERARIAVPGFKPDWILSAENMRRTAEIYGIGDQSWGTPVAPNADEPWITDQRTPAADYQSRVKAGEKGVPSSAVVGADGQDRRQEASEGKAKPLPEYVKRLIGMNPHPEYLRSKVVAEAFGGRIGWDSPSWKRMLGDSKSWPWLHEARTNPNAEPYSHAYWHPFVIAWAIAIGGERIAKKVATTGTTKSTRKTVKWSLAALDAVFNSSGMGEWSLLWQNQERAQLDDALDLLQE